MKLMIPTKQLLNFQHNLRKNPERYFERAFTDTIVSTMLLENEHITHEQVKTISAPIIRSLIHHGTFKKLST